MIEYFVDEAGDSALWGRRGKVLIGTKGCSSYFILGMIRVDDAARLALEANELRSQILADPYFRGVPSLDPARRRTAIAFHAKDDPPEVRRDFFKLLLRHEMTFHAVVRDKTKVARIVRDSTVLHPNYKYNQNQLYDDLARRLFHDKLHQEDAYSVVFARRGHSDRTRALQGALENARERHCSEQGVQFDAPITARYAVPPEQIELQVVDYCLWAVQRAYEMREDRFIRLLWPHVHCVWDCDDIRGGKSGTRYTKEKPLDAANILRNRQQI